ncbi:hypothetical protein EDB87DRAFT_1191203 [Lactarius vividus]|nr:hypothetical protein EDB87DRAFT_1191203 [Lactarius vividus]
MCWLGLNFLLIRGCLSGGAANDRSSSPPCLYALRVLSSDCGGPHGRLATTEVLKSVPDTSSIQRIIDPLTLEFLTAMPRDVALRRTVCRKCTVQRSEKKFVHCQGEKKTDPLL